MTDPSVLTDLRIFDVEPLINLVGDEMSAVGLAQDYAGKLISTLDRLEEAIKTKNVGGVSGVSHELKGSAATFGANRLAKVATDLNHLARSATDPLADDVTLPFLAQLREEGDRFIAAVSKSDSGEEEEEEAAPGAASSDNADLRRTSSAGSLSGANEGSAIAEDPLMSLAAVPSSVPVMDLTGLLELTGGDVPMAAEMLAKYALKIVDSVARLREAANERDHGALGSVSHEMKGSSATFGGARVSQVATRLNVRCKKGGASLDADAVETLVSMAEKESASFLEIINKVDKGGPDVLQEYVKAPSTLTEPAAPESAARHRRSPQRKSTAVPPSASERRRGGAIGGLGLADMVWERALTACDMPIVMLSGKGCRIERWNPATTVTTGTFGDKVVGKSLFDVAKMPEADEEELREHVARALVGARRIDKPALPTDDDSSEEEETAPALPLTVLLPAFGCELTVSGSFVANKKGDYVLGMLEKVKMSSEPVTRPRTKTGVPVMVTGADEASELSSGGDSSTNMRRGRSNTIRGGGGNGSATLRRGGGALMRDESGRQPYALVVDDDAVLRSVTSALLQQLGFKCESVGDGSQALRFLDKFRFDLMLLDLFMPDMDGFITASLIRQRERMDRRLPIIALTAAADDPEIRQKCRDAGMDAILEKPVRRAAVESAIKRVLRKTPGLAGFGGAAAGSRDSGSASGSSPLTGYPSGYHSGTNSGPSSAQSTLTRKTSEDGELLIFDISIVADLLEDSGSEVWVVIERFIQSAEESIERLQTLLTDNDQVQLLANKLKGSAGTVGAQRVREAAAALRDAPAEGRADALTNLSRSLTEFDAQVERSRRSAALTGGASQASSVHSGSDHEGTAPSAARRAVAVGAEVFPPLFRVAPLPIAILSPQGDVLVASHEMTGIVPGLAANDSSAKGKDGSSGGSASAASSGSRLDRRKSRAESVEGAVRNLSRKGSTRGPVAYEVNLLDVASLAPGETERVRDFFSPDSSDLTIVARIESSDGIPVMLSLSRTAGFECVVATARMAGGIVSVEDGVDSVHMALARRMPNILVVDDDEVLLAVTSGLLRRLGFSCETVSDGANALRFLDRFKFDLVLLDLMMDPMDGFETAKAARAHETERGERRVPLIALTASADDDDAKEKCVEAGIDYVLEKPITRDGVLRAMSHVLGIGTAEGKVGDGKHSHTAKPADGDATAADDVLGGASASERLVLRVGSALAMVASVDDMRAAVDRTTEGAVALFDTLSSLASAVSRGNKESLTKLVPVAQSVRGSAATIGAERLADQASAVIAAARNLNRAQRNKTDTRVRLDGDTDIEKLLRAIRELRVEIAALREVSELLSLAGITLKRSHLLFLARWCRASGKSSQMMLYIGVRRTLSLANQSNADIRQLLEGARAVHGKYLAKGCPLPAGISRRVCKLVAYALQEAMQAGPIDGKSSGHGGRTPGRGAPGRKETIRSLTSALGEVEREVEARLGAESFTQFLRSAAFSDLQRALLLEHQSRMHEGAGGDDSFTSSSSSVSDEARRRKRFVLRDRDIDMRNKDELLSTPAPDESPVATAFIGVCGPRSTAMALFGGWIVTPLASVVDSSSGARGEGGNGDRRERRRSSSDKMFSRLRLRRSNSGLSEESEWDSDSDDDSPRGPAAQPGPHTTLSGTSEATLRKKRQAEDAAASLGPAGFVEGTSLRDGSPVDSFDIMIKVSKTKTLYIRVFLFQDPAAFATAGHLLAPSLDALVVAVDLVYLAQGVGGTSQTVDEFLALAAARQAPPVLLVGCPPPGSQSLSDKTLKTNGSQSISESAALQALQDLSTSLVAQHARSGISFGPVSFVPDLRSKKAQRSVQESLVAALTNSDDDRRVPVLYSRVLDSLRREGTSLTDASFPPILRSAQVELAIGKLGIARTVEDTGAVDHCLAYLSWRGLIIYLNRGDRHRSVILTDPRWLTCAIASAIVRARGGRRRGRAFRPEGSLGSDEAIRFLRGDITWPSATRQDLLAMFTSLGVFWTAAPERLFFSALQPRDPPDVSVLWTPKYDPKLSQISRVYSLVPEMSVDKLGADRLFGSSGKASFGDASVSMKSVSAASIMVSGGVEPTSLFNCLLASLARGASEVIATWATGALLALPSRLGSSHGQGGKRGAMLGGDQASRPNNRAAPTTGSRARRNTSSQRDVSVSHGVRSLASRLDGASETVHCLLSVSSTCVAITLRHTLADVSGVLGWVDGASLAAIERWFHVRPRTYVLCVACAEHSMAPHFYSLEECEAVAALADPNFRCDRLQLDVPVRSLAPDAVEMFWGSGLTQAIDSNDIADREVIFGNADYGVCVWRGRWNGVEVAVKRVTAKEEEGGPSVAVPSPGGGGGAVGPAMTAAQQQSEVALSMERKFKTEVSLLGSLAHPNVVQLWGFTRVPEAALVLEWVQYGSLFHLINDADIAAPANDIFDLAKGITRTRKCNDGVLTEFQAAVASRREAWAKLLAEDKVVLEAGESFLTAVEAAVATVQEDPSNLQAVNTAERAATSALSVLLRKHAMPADFARRVALDTSAALLYLHSRDPPILHMDLKSPNVLIASLDPSADVVGKLADFGVSKRLYSGEEIAPDARNRDVDNPVWSAPELMIEGASIGREADVYSFGVVLYELCTRCRPFYEVNVRSMSALESAVVRDGVRPTIPSWVSPAYASLCESSFQADPSQRMSFADIHLSLLDASTTQKPFDREVDPSVPQKFAHLRMRRPSGHASAEAGATGSSAGATSLAPPNTLSPAQATAMVAESRKNTMRNNKLLAAPSALDRSTSSRALMAAVGADENLLGKLQALEVAMRGTSVAMTIGLERPELIRVPAKVGDVTPVHGGVLLAPSMEEDPRVRDDNACVLYVLNGISRYSERAYALAVSGATTCRRLITLSQSLLLLLTPTSALLLDGDELGARGMACVRAGRDDVGVPVTPLLAIPGKFVDAQPVYHEMLTSRTANGVARTLVGALLLGREGVLSRWSVSRSESSGRITLVREQGYIADFGCEVYCLAVTRGKKSRSNDGHGGHGHGHGNSGGSGAGEESSETVSGLGARFSGARPSDQGGAGLSFADKSSDRSIEIHAWVGTKDYGIRIVDVESCASRGSVPGWRAGENPHLMALESGGQVWASGCTLADQPNALRPYVFSTVTRAHIGSAREAATGMQERDALTMVEVGDRVFVARGRAKGGCTVEPYSLHTLRPAAAPIVVPANVQRFCIAWGRVLFAVTDNKGIIRLR
jgi:CheY-like chemotaxis protein/serine/threonine protein kinase/HPt (histidine-containing phosphotransfer) domain-containing protein